MIKSYFFIPFRLGERQKIKMRRDILGKFPSPTRRGDEGVRSWTKARFRNSPPTPPLLRS
jgi:hypothetical protein